MGTLINNYSQLDSNILEMQLTLDQTRKGKHDVGLTNYDTTAEPQIAAGSVIEVNGGLYKFTSNETILDTEGVSDGTVYIMIVPATGSCTAEYTNTAPTWDDGKQGWYGTASTAGYRYLEFVITKSSTLYSNKSTYTHDDNITLDIANINTINLTNPLNPIKQYNSILNGLLTNGAVFTALDLYIPTDGNRIKINGAVMGASATYICITSYAERINSTTINIIGMRISDGVSVSFPFINGNASSTTVNFSW